ncbi:hypothetical protein EDC01DRAFT_759927 [Geopyxis carbonaria]|nr:hypothetical protein EDC01DRAFT_759927 [Geopyxis carbonaria]
MELQPPPMKRHRHIRYNQEVNSCLKTNNLTAPCIGCVPTHRSGMSIGRQGFMPAANCQACPNQPVRPETARTPHQGGWYVSQSALTLWLVGATLKQGCLHNYQDRVIMRERIKTAILKASEGISKALCRKMKVGNGTPHSCWRDLFQTVNERVAVTMIVRAQEVYMEARLLPRVLINNSSLHTLSQTLINNLNSTPSSSQLNITSFSIQLDQLNKRSISHILQAPSMAPNKTTASASASTYESVFGPTDPAIQRERSQRLIYYGADGFPRVRDINKLPITSTAAQKSKAQFLVGKSGRLSSHNSGSTN